VFGLNVVHGIENQMQTVVHTKIFCSVENDVFAVYGSYVEESMTFTGILANIRGVISYKTVVT